MGAPNAAGEEKMKINYYKVSNSLIAKHLVKSNYIRMLLEQMKVMLDLNWEKIKYTSFSLCLSLCILREND